jgi:4-amino-4-deoxy-L-arabinose transferase-like glycosyltransferase
MSSRTRQLTLLSILAVSLALRVRYLMTGVPLAVEIDEPAIVDRALAIMNSGNWHPRGFDYPSLVVYIQAVANIAQFLRGAVEGLWPSLDRYAIASAYEAGRFVSAAIGTATVWLTYRLGKEEQSPALGLVAAAQLAVYPMHVRESHFALTDSPATAFVVLALFLTVRATRVRTVAAYTAASAAAGFALAAKYNAGVVALVLPLAWLLSERKAPDRRRKLIAIAVAPPLAFLVAVPYAVIDLPGFLSGLGAQVARFSTNAVAGGDDAPWRVYLVHLSLASGIWLPLAGLGALLLVWRREELRRWSVLFTFLAVYYYVLSTHGIVFGRYALPLVPVLCVFAAVPIVELARAAAERWPRRQVSGLLLAGSLALVLTPLLRGSIDWLQGFHRLDTREIAGRWMIAALPKRTRIVVENSGPTNLDHLGFDVVERPNRIGPVQEYQARGAQYLLLATFSERDLPGYGPVVSTGRVVFGIDPGRRRWGPYIRAVKLEAAP